MRYELGDLIEVTVKKGGYHSHIQSGTYRLAAARTGSFHGRWVYTGPPDPSFSLLLSGRAPFWYITVEGKIKVTCA